MNGSWAAIGFYDDPSPQQRSLNCSGVKRGNKLEFVLVATGYSVELHAIGMTYPQKVTMEPDHRGSVDFFVDFAGDASPAYRCRLTERGTLACLVGAGGVEFKKMTVEPGQIYEVTVVR